jgi:murein DD-endopeptidase MepM/ murein hydrolase activator NlpD
MPPTPLKRLGPLLLLAAVSACGGGSHPAAQVAASTPPAVTAAPSATPTATPTPTAAPTAAPTPSPTRAASARPRASASPSSLPSYSRVVGRYVFPVQGCRVSYAHSHHDYPATDIFAARGCAVVSPVTGTVDEVSSVDRWSSSTNRGADRGGLSFSVVGTDGVRYYGSHLSVVSVRPGQHVTAGTLIGRVGNSGDARGIATHLHFGISWPTRHGIWWVRRGEVYPWRYLDSWRAGGALSPAAAVAAAHRQQGDVPPCRVDC